MGGKCVAHELEVDVAFFRNKKADEMYPWDKWTNGSTWSVKKEEDFFVQIESFRTYLYNKAHELGIRVNTRIVTPTEIIFRYYSQNRGGYQRN
jgi:hypothetical protein